MPVSTVELCTVNLIDPKFILSGVLLTMVCVPTCVFLTGIQEAVKVCKDYMKRDPNEVNFNIIALSAAE